MNNKNTENEIFFNFSYFAMKLLGKGLYSNAWTAIAELVANGFDAKATEVYILLDMRNKKSATIEILDNGYGMDYQDLAEKYVMIGKNKRQSDTIDEETKKEVMGRKGVGKLAALYLSNKFYILSKSKKHYSSSWYLDLKSANDSDTPKLNRANTNEIEILSENVWKELHTGTLIKLTNVNLSNIGFYTIEGLKANLADFYLIDELNKKIFISVVTNDKDKMEFNEIKKNIAFKNMYAFFCTEDSKQYLNNLSKEVSISPTGIDLIDKKRREVQILNPEAFNIKGEEYFVNESDEKILLPYELKGWIGIHSSIDGQLAYLNDPTFLKNKARKPCRLRLYIRKKLAVDNFMDTLASTQAFASYIEGEISFDILDDNRLPDITTSNRQDIAQDNARLELLKNILNPIINTLIKERIKIANTINEEARIYKEKQEAEAKQREEKAENKRKEAEEKRQKAENEKHSADEARRKAEEEKQAAEKARKKAEEEKQAAEKARRKAEKEKERAEAETASEKHKNFFYGGLISEEKKEFAKRFHLVTTNTLSITNATSDLILSLEENKIKDSDIWQDVVSISYNCERIKAILQYGALADFDTECEMIEADLFSFIQQYCVNFLDKKNKMKINVKSDHSQYIRKFSPQNIIVILENVFSNSEKHKADSLLIELSKTKKEYCIRFIDNGTGLNENARKHMNELFEFGKSYSNFGTGTGIGLYHIKEIVNKMKGYVDIDDQYKKGFCLQMGFRR